MPTGLLLEFAVDVLTSLSTFAFSGLGYGIEVWDFESLRVGVDASCLLEIEVDMPRHDGVLNSRDLHT